MSKIFRKKRCDDEGGGMVPKGGLLDDGPKAIQTNKVTPQKKIKIKTTTTCTHIQVVLWNLITQNMRLQIHYLGEG